MLGRMPHRPPTALDPDLLERPRAHGTVPRAAVGQVDGRRWVSLEGPVRVGRERAEITEAERRYAERYRTPRVNARGSSW
jgi:hypothetical protein